MAFGKSAGERKQFERTQLMGTQNWCLLTRRKEKVEIKKNQRDER